MYRVLECHVHICTRSIPVSCETFQNLSRAVRAQAESSLLAVRDGVPVSRKGRIFPLPTCQDVLGVSSGPLCKRGESVMRDLW